VSWMISPRDGSDGTTLIVAFEGWSDAAEAATLAAKHIRFQLRARRVASIDPDNYFDFTVTRPQIKLSSTGVRRLTWPESKFYLANPGNGPRTLIGLGPEPQLRWKSFSKSVLKIADTYKVDRVITLGALLSEVPHTRPIRVVGTTANDQLSELLGLSRPTYEGPTGILGVLQAAFEARGADCISLWANVPHYVAQTPSPKAALALVRRVSTLIDLHLDTAELESETAEYDTQIDEAVSSDAEAQAYVAQLENATADLIDDGLGLLDITTAEELAVEAERYLKGHSNGE
jgi:proteasome assembly chaperone (PAC2) family protein